MSEYYKIIEKIECYMYFNMLILRSRCTTLFQWPASSETGFAGALQHNVSFICCENVGSESRRGKKVENKERHFQEVAKGNTQGPVFGSQCKPQT